MPVDFVMRLLTLTISCRNSWYRVDLGDSPESPDDAVGVGRTASDVAGGGTELCGFVVGGSLCLALFSLAVVFSFDFALWGSSC